MRTAGHDDDTKDTIAVQSTMDYLGSDMGLNIEDASIFVALELLQAPSVGEITRKGFVEGWKATGYAAPIPIRSRFWGLGANPRIAAPVESIPAKPPMGRTSGT